MTIPNFTNSTSRDHATSKSFERGMPDATTPPPTKATRAIWRNRNGLV